MDGGGERLSVDGNCGRPPADGAAVRLRRTAGEDGPGRRRTSVGSSDASGRPPDAAVDVRTRDNPAQDYKCWKEKGSPFQHFGGIKQTYIQEYKQYCTLNLILRIFYHDIIFTDD
jgi:hypothetical protein